MRIVIVEDEIKTLQGIEKLIQNLGNEYIIVGCARNGRDGLELIHKLQPDVVLTDIMMPLIGGLEMIQKLLEVKCKSKFIILSGYAEFNYAQEAIKLGSVEYVLKPITQEALNKALQHAGQLLKNESEKIDPKKYGNKELLSAIIESQGGRGQELFYELEKRIGPWKKWVFCLLRNDLRTCVKDQLRMQDILLEKFENKVVYYFSENKRNCILILSQTNQKQSMQLLEKVKEKMEQDIPAEICFSFFAPENNEDFHMTLERIREESNWHISLQSNQILTKEWIQNMQCEKLVYPVGQERKVVENIYAGKTQETKKEIETFISYLTEKIYDYREVREAVICLTVAILYAIRQSSYGIYDEINHLNVLDWMKDKIRLSSVRNMLINMINELERYQNTIQSASHPLVKKALKIIDHDYKRDISVEEVAGLLHITPEYLGGLFTRELGIKFTVYCTQKRIALAKELFRNQDAKVYEIAEACGYLDVKYFCKVFKKYTGKSPSDYQHSFYA